MNPFISAHLLLYSFPHPFSILVILVFVLRNSVSLLAFFKTFVLSSPVQSPLSQNLPSFLRNTFRIPFIVPLETQRTPEGGKPKHCSKLSSDVVLWERELRQSNESDNLWDQSSTRGSAHTHLWPLYLSFSLLIFPVASLPASLHWMRKKIGEVAVIFLLVSGTDCKPIKLRSQGRLALVGSRRVAKPKAASTTYTTQVVSLGWMYSVLKCISN